VTYDTVSELHIGRGLVGPCAASTLRKNTSESLEGKHVLLLDLAYCSRIQVAPRTRTARVNRTRGGAWERMGERDLPPVQDWLKHGATYESLYNCKLWHISFKGELKIFNFTNNK
jgi:hypothetical protein